MYFSFREPTLAEILSEPIIKAVMRADCVDPEELNAMLSKIAREARNSGGSEMAHSQARERDRHPSM